MPASSSPKFPKAAKGYWLDPQGQKVPSVTTVLNATRPPEAREALARWRDRIGAAEAGRIAAIASRRGTLTHSQLRHHLLGTPIPCPDLVRPYWDSLQPVLADIEGVHLVEDVVFHSDLGYAGKVDCVVQMQGQACLLDWKTADRPKETHDRLYDAPLQLAAYCGAINHSRRDQGLHIQQAKLVYALPDQPAEVFDFETDALRDCWEAWCKRLAEFYGDRPHPHSSPEVR